MSREYPLVISEFSEQTVFIEDHIRRELRQAGPVRILEAGCGRKWATGLEKHRTERGSRSYLGQGLVAVLSRTLARVIAWLSLGSLKDNHADLMYILRKD